MSRAACSCSASSDWRMKCDPSPKYIREAQPRQYHSHTAAECAPEGDHPAHRRKKNASPGSHTQWQWHLPREGGERGPAAVSAPQQKQLTTSRSPYCLFWCALRPAASVTKKAYRAVLRRRAPDGLLCARRTAHGPKRPLLPAMARLLAAGWLAGWLLAGAISACMLQIKK